MVNGAITIGERGLFETHVQEFVLQCWAVSVIERNGRVSSYTWLEPSLGPDPGQLQCMCGELAGLTLVPGPLLPR